MQDEKVIKDAQYRKGLSIGYFNALNSAIALVASDDRYRADTPEKTIETVGMIRDTFIEQHKEYYANVIANIGNYDPEATLKKIKATKSLPELKIVWLSLSQDERNDEKIIKAKNDQKKKYEEA